MVPSESRGSAYSDFPKIFIQVLLIAQAKQAWGQGLSGLPALWISSNTEEAALKLDYAGSFPT